MGTSKPSAVGPHLQNCPGWHTAPQWVVHMHTIQFRMLSHCWLGSFWQKVCKTQLKTLFSCFFSDLHSRHFLTRCQVPASVSGKREMLNSRAVALRKIKQCNISRTCETYSVNSHLPHCWGMSAVMGTACHNGLLWPSLSVTAEGPANEK